MSERTALYRLFAADDTLLYVGVAKRFGTRWEQHAKLQPWWPHVDHQTVYWLPGREDALLAEKAAIAAERPVYNIAGSPWVGGVKHDGTGFYVLPKRPKPILCNLRVRDGLWRAAQEKARAEGRSMTDVIVAYLRRYVSTPPRKRGTDE